MKKVLKGFMTTGRADINFYNNDNDIICYESEIALELDVVIKNPELAFTKWLKNQIKDCLKMKKRDLKHNSYIFIKESSGYVGLEEDMTKDENSELSYVHHRVYYNGFSGKARVKRKNNKLYLEGWEFKFDNVHYTFKKSYKTHRDWKALGIEKYTEEEMRLKNLAERNFEIFCKTGEVIPVK